MPQTLFGRVWDDHVIKDFGDGYNLLHIDRHMLHEVSARQFRILNARKLDVRNPELNFAAIEHFTEIHPGRTYESRVPQATEFFHETLTACEQRGIRIFGIDDPRNGIVHVIAPELGLTLPGTIVVCADSHTCTNGALGALAWGIGSSEGAHVLATQTIIQRKPKSMRVQLTGSVQPGISPKDLILHIIGVYSAAGGVDHAIEYSGPVIERMDMDGRMTMCNMAVEFGGRAGMIAPDDTVYSYLYGREYTPTGALWDQALAYWKTLHTSDDAVFDKDITVDCTSIGPQVTWGTSPEHVMSVDQPIPDPSKLDATIAQTRSRSLDYMGLAPGEMLEGLSIQGAFIGTCTNSRLDDIRDAAKVIRGRKVPEGVRAVCVPGSQPVKKAAEAEGLDIVFKDAGFEWGEPSCSLCQSNGGDAFPAGARVISSSNRNFENRQGSTVRTHLASPATVAASAVAGKIADIRKLGH